MIEREPDGEVEVVRFAHGPVNALDVEMLRAICETFEELRKSDARAIVLTGAGRAFSAGADLIRVLNEGESYVRASLPVLSEAFLSVFTFPRPVVAAINGHAIAGGAVFAFACDHRVMARAGTFGLAELKVGVPFPVAALEIVRFALGARGLQEAVYFGDGYSPDDALARGMVDEVVDPDALASRALEVARRLAAVPAESFAHVKANLRRPTLERVERLAPELDPEAARLWYSNDVRAAIRAFLETLGRR